MRTKTKLSLGVGLLFVLVVLLTVVSTYFVNVLSTDTKNILKDNYQTLDYSSNMLLALDSMAINRQAGLLFFEENLKKQQANITEKGELELTEALALKFRQLAAGKLDSANYHLLRADLYGLMEKNMHAIVQKSQRADRTADNAAFWIAATGALCFLLAFVLLINLPGSIANQVKELTEKIQLIAAKNYHQRVQFKAGSEFADLADAFNTMAKKLEEYEGSSLAQLLVEKARIDTLIENMHDPVIGLDEARNIAFVNQEALKLLNASRKQLIGHAAEDAASKNDLLRTLIQSDNQPGDDPLRIVVNGKEGYFEKEVLDITGKPPGELHLRPLGQVVLLRNITPFKELDFAKTHFIATISHELKTPIASIKMSLQLLENKQTGVLNEEQFQLVHSIGDDASRLLKITGELLNMSQAETGNIQLTIKPSDPRNMIDRAIDAVHTQAGQKNLMLEVHASDDLPEVKADAEKTVWVLINLLGNAVRHAPEQSRVRLDIKQEGLEMVFAVSDHGPGIDPKYQERVFERYFQVPGSKSSGSGLGLAISREFIEAQGGRIGVESELGEGSRFYFYLPLA
ncbi:MAG: PAS domain-containing protein [Saprospiraceae bacterium]|nr:PAS domain-containing protein [Saprospiraceae bacterium]